MKDKAADPGPSTNFLANAKKSLVTGYTGPDLLTFSSLPTFSTASTHTGRVLIFGTRHSRNSEPLTKAAPTDTKMALE
jgi:hypothetical protein